MRASSLPIGLHPGLEQRSPSLAYRVAFDAMCALRRHRNAVGVDTTAGGGLLREAEKVLAGRCSAFEKAGVTMADPDAKDTTAPKHD